jgi:hypothetical protein
MAYVDIYTAATSADSTLRKQITVAFLKAAVDILNEADDYANHGNRVTWGRRVTESSANLLADTDRWIWKVLENTTIQAAPTTATDNDVQFAVNSILDIVVNR